MRSHTQSVVIEPNRRRITGSISYKPLISDLSVIKVCNKTGGTIKRRYKKCSYYTSIRTSLGSTFSYCCKHFGVPKSAFLIDVPMT